MQVRTSWSAATSAGLCAGTSTLARRLWRLPLGCRRTTRTCKQSTWPCTRASWKGLMPSTTVRSCTKTAAWQQGGSTCRPHACSLALQATGYPHIQLGALRAAQRRPSKLVTVARACSEHPHISCTLGRHCGQLLGFCRWSPGCPGWHNYLAAFLLADQGPRQGGPIRGCAFCLLPLVGPFACSQHQ